MALIQCPECGEKISDTARCCVHCGFPINEESQAETVKKAEGKKSADLQATVINEKPSEKSEKKKPVRKKRSEQDKIFVALIEKWVKQDNIIALISIALKTLLIIIMVSLILIRFFISLQASLEQNSSIREFALSIISSKVEMSYYALMFQIWGFLEFLRICIIKIIKICTEKMRAAAIQEIGTKKYLYFMKNSLGGDSAATLEFFMLAMPLEVAEERKKRIIFTVIYFIEAVAVLIYYMSFIGVLSVQIYDFSNPFEFFFKNMLGFIISGIVLLTVHIILMVKDNPETRCGEWLSSIVIEEPETEQEEVPADILPQAKKPQAVPAGKKQKNKVAALLLCFFLGELGVHRFYEGKIGTGVLYLLTFGLCGVGVIIDFIKLLCKPNPYYV